MPSVCKKCGGTMAQRSDPRLWQCTSCGAGVMELFLEDKIGVSDALGVEGQSKAKVDGLPEQEFSRFSDERGGTSAQDVDRSQPDGDVDRVVRHPTRYRRDAQGKMKRAEECDAVRRLLRSFNEVHGTAHRDVESDERDLDADVRVDDRKFQVTQADCVPWRGLGSSAAAHAEHLTEAELVERFLAAAEAKKTRAAADLVLVLDGAGVSTPQGTVKKLMTEKQTALAAIGFAEIWWSDRHRATRLFPPDPRSVA